MIIQESNQFFLERPKKHSEVRQFSFPSTEEIFKRFISIEIKDFMDLLNTNQNPQNSKLYRCRILKKKYGYMKCRYCFSFIRLKLISNGELEVSAYNNTHKHNSNYFKKRQQIQVLQFIDSFQGNRTYLMDTIINRFSISKRRYYYIVNKAQKRIQFTDLLRQLEFKGYDILTQDVQNQQYPEIFIYSTPEMGKLFHRFGDVCAFDITYNIIKQRNANKRQWGVGVFTGLDTNLRILIFAVVLISNQSTNSMEKLFDGFFKLYHRQPGVIITDEQPSIISALKILKSKRIFVGYHLLDTFHILKNIRKKVEKKQFPIYKKMIKDRNEQLFEITMEYALRQIENKQVLENFLRQKIQFCCFSMIPHVFIGMSSSNSRNQKLNDIMKGFIPRQVYWATFFNRMDKVMNHIKNNTNKKQIQSKPFQSLFKDNGIAAVRTQVQRKIFNYFLANYVRGLKLSCQKITENEYVCWNSKEKWFVVEDCCKCGVYSKSGIPCQHVLRANWNENKKNYIDLFNKRWLLVQEDAKETRGRPRNSRRNLIR